ncbi:FPF1-like protein 1 [Zea mays]|uniref:FPF1-like protein 1 n=1 Tax=Zea mays TaxID=4577 RepID=A0A1D6J4Q0_MAIZE|nr:FPF1-like protein 1 [Zea mays]
MSGVWVFEDGIVRRADSDPPSGAGAGGSRPNKVLVHVPSGEVVTSYDVLERRLRELGWERYLYDPCLLQFHQRSTVHLITVPRDFSRLKLVHMYDVVVKTRNVFERVRVAASCMLSYFVCRRINNECVPKYRDNTQRKKSSGTKDITTTALSSNNRTISHPLGTI